MKIAIIGSGISGLTCAHLLGDKHEVDLYEANDYLGGHTHTVMVGEGAGQQKIDTGFIVYNDRTYPRFEKLMKRIGIRPQNAEMSFSVVNQDNGLEYNGHNLDTLFSQRKNIFSFKFYGLISEILRFNRSAIDLHELANVPEMTLGQYLEREKFSNYFCDNYLLPMVGAIWSCSLNEALGFPLRLFVNFFYHHGLLSISNRPQWYVVEGGSSSYIPGLIESVKDNCYLNTPVMSVERSSIGVTILSKQGKKIYDQVIFACHSDQALKLLSDPTNAEVDVLSGMKYQSNDVVLHTDKSIMPVAKRAWASWNFRLNDVESQRNKPALITYYMNRLQSLSSDTDYFVTLNGRDLIDPNKIIDSYEYHHPVMDMEMFNNQKRWYEISGKNQTHFCGAYWHNGFHEDGVHSAVNVCHKFGVKL